MISEPAPLSTDLISVSSDEQQTSLAVPSPDEPAHFPPPSSSYPFAIGSACGRQLPKQKTLELPPQQPATKPSPETTLRSFHHANQQQPPSSQPSYIFYLTEADSSGKFTRRPLARSATPAEKRQRKTEDKRAQRKAQAARKKMLKRILGNEPLRTEKEFLEPPGAWVIMIESLRKKQLIWEEKALLVDYLFRHCCKSAGKFKSLENVRKTMRKCWAELQSAKGAPAAEDKMIDTMSVHKALAEIFRYVNGSVTDISRSESTLTKRISATSACAATLLGILHCVGNHPPHLECIEEDHHKFRATLSAPVPSGCSQLVSGDSSGSWTSTTETHAFRDGQFEFTMLVVDLPAVQGCWKLTGRYRYSSLCISLMRVPAPNKPRGLFFA